MMRFRLTLRVLIRGQDDVQRESMAMAAAGQPRLSALLHGTTSCPETGANAELFHVEHSRREGRITDHPALLVLTVAREI